MLELIAFLGTGLALMFCASLLLLTVGLNFAPTWAKSRMFLLVTCAVVVVGAGSIA